LYGGSGRRFAYREYFVCFPVGFAQVVHEILVSLIVGDHFVALQHFVDHFAVAYGPLQGCCRKLRIETFRADVVIDVDEVGLTSHALRGLQVVVESPDFIAEPAAVTFVRLP
jgi:hypothetical protein